MKRLLLDTNIYGYIVADNDRDNVHAWIHTNDKISLYGFEVIRKELRSTKRNVCGLRMDLLRIYDDFVKKTYGVEDAMNELAEEYYNTYLELGGNRPKDKLMNDFLIIACSSLKDLDIVVSNDENTMLNELQIRAYRLTNKNKGVRLPSFINYDKFKNVIKK